MPALNITKHARIVKNGGPITSDVYKSNATSTWTAGALLKLVNGALQHCVDTSGGGAALTTAHTGSSNARLFIALDDHKTAGAEFVSVQEIRPNTILELQICATGSTDPKPANVTKGANYSAYQIGTAGINGNGVWGLNVDGTSNAFLNVIDVESNWSPFDPEAKNNYAKVWVKVLDSILA